MKTFKKLTAIALASVSLMSITACSLPFDLPFDIPFFGNNDGEKIENSFKVEKISSDLLNGKVANLMSASGLGIEDKGEVTPDNATATASETATKDGLIVAKADNGKVKQNVHELIKAMGDETQDVRFHNNGKGSYKWWNKKLGEHHHDGVLCEVKNCAELSDEIKAMEETENTPTILSMGARVNKLYNGGDYTFVCVSAEVEGEVQLITETSSNYMHFETKAYAEMLPTLINTPDFTEKGLVLSYLNLNTGDQKGMILVKTFESEEHYHQVNYWSDDFNQSYVIDNSTGITYSLAEKFPYIYSITGNVISVWTGGARKIFDYYTVSVENDELKFDKLELPDESSPYYSLINQSQSPLVDIYGNVVFQSYSDIEQIAKDLALTLQGEEHFTEELRYPENQKIIFSGYNKTLFIEKYKSNGHDPLRSAGFGEYQRSIRYFRGSDGRIYRFAYLGSLKNIPVKVLDENGAWQDVDQTTTTYFAPQTGYMFAMNRNGSMASGQTFFKVTEISNGYAYFDNATWAEQAGYLHLGCMTTQMEGEPVGVIKMPVNGGEDTELLALTQKLAGQGIERVYRTGNTAMVYKDGTNLILWDRKTNEKSTIKNANGELTPIGRGAACFMYDNLYIPYSGIEFEWKLENFSTTLIERQVKLEAFYELLTNKE